jgi:hypothetical protein
MHCEWLRRSRQSTTARLRFTPSISTRGSTPATLLLPIEEGLPVIRSVKKFTLNTRQTSMSVNDSENGPVYPRSIHRQVTVKKRGCLASERINNRLVELLRLDH